MLLVTKASDDNSFAYIVNTDTKEITRYTKSKLEKTDEVIQGLIKDRRGNIIKLKTYSFVECETYNAAIDYCNENNIPLSLIKQSYSSVYVLIENKNIVHVDYYIGHCTEVEKAYKSKLGRTSIKEYATLMKRDEAYRECAIANKRLAKKYNKTDCGYWQVYSEEKPIR